MTDTTTATNGNDEAIENPYLRGSKPLPRTIFSKEIDNFDTSDTLPTQNFGKDLETDMSKWPVKIKHRKKILARIYRPCEGRGSYRVAWKAAGKRQMKSFPNYSGDEGAKKYADNLVKQLAKQSSVALLTPAQADDALAAIGLLNAYRESTGQHITLVSAVSELVEAKKKLHGRSMSEAVAGFMRDSVTVKSKPIGEAVELFIESRQHKNDSKNGKRAQLSSSYTTHVNSWLREFAGTFPGEAVCDLTKQHLNLYMQQHTEVGTKNRNDRRAAVKMFLNWVVKNDYLSFGHRLFEADAMTREIVETAETDYYRPDELQKFLENAGTELQPVIAIAGLAGLRGEEIMRLEWSDVWRVPGHIEISSSKSKTRQRRLVEICPALAGWLMPCRSRVGKVFPRGMQVFQREFLNLRREVLKIPDRRNGLRHGFCTYHFALHSNENLTAQQAGNSPQMIHGNYKGLAVKTDAEKWFAIMPTTSPAERKAAHGKKSDVEGK